MDINIKVKIKPEKIRMYRRLRERNGKRTIE
jgi:hypothetical protein